MPSLLNIVINLQVGEGSTSTKYKLERINDFHLAQKHAPVAAIFWLSELQRNTVTVTEIILRGAYDTIDSVAHVKILTHVHANSQARAAHSFTMRCVASNIAQAKKRAEDMWAAVLQTCVDQLLSKLSENDVVLHRKVESALSSPDFQRGSVWQQKSASIFAS